MAGHVHDRRGFCIYCRSPADEDEYCEKWTKIEEEYKVRVEEMKKEVEAREGCWEKLLQLRDENRRLKQACEIFERNSADATQLYEEKLAAEKERDRLKQDWLNWTADDDVAKIYSDKLQLEVEKELDRLRKQYLKLAMERDLFKKALHAIEQVGHNPADLVPEWIGLPDRYELLVNHLAAMAMAGLQGKEVLPWR